MSPLEEYDTIELCRVSAIEELKVGIEKYFSSTKMSLIEGNSTIFIRNLPFSTTTEQLTSLCDSIGPVKRAFLIDSGKKDGQNRAPKGIGFVEFCLSSDAMKAVTSLNGTQFNNRTIGVYFAEDKQQKSEPSNTRSHAKTTRKHKPWRLIARNLPFSISESRLRTFFSPCGELEDVYLPAKTAPSNDRQPAPLGFAFITYAKKKDAEKALAELNGKSLGKRPIILDYCVPQETFISSSSEPQPSTSSEVPSPSNSEEQDMEGEEDVEEGVEENVKQDQYETDLSCSVFIRNLPTSATSAEIVKLFTRYGHICAVRIVKDRITHIPRGSAFVIFSKPESACRCLAECNLSPPCLSSRVIEVLSAVKRDDINEQRKLKHATHDKRNLYLASEGDILPDTEAFTELTEVEQKKREAWREEKMAKLASPNYVVNPCRLLVRNLSPNIDEKTVRSVFKTAAAHAAVQFGDEKLSKVKVKQVKLVKDDTRLDEKGEARSKGYGFVEFFQHLHALAALRFLNNNPNISELLNRRPAVEFALDNSFKVQKFQRSAGFGGQSTSKPITKKATKNVESSGNSSQNNRRRSSGRREPPRKKSRREEFEG
ncbi:hypothetical protein RCL1_002636 [Eukaryota sp. TZLM3-RCL]